MSPVRGLILEEWWRGGVVRDDVFPGECVVMPDHFHGLIRIERGASGLGHVIGAFKAAVARGIRRGDVQMPCDVRIWLRNYYESIVRTPEAERNIAGYIRMNPWRCAVDLGNGLRGIGNPALLNREKIAMLCSRYCPPPLLAAAEARALAAGPDSCFIGGFHSPPEQVILQALLNGGANLICCPAWGVDHLLIPPPWLSALEQNRMLILEIRRGDTPVAPSLAAAEARNRFVLQTAESCWIPYVARGGMLERLIAEHPRD